MEQISAHESVWSVSGLCIVFEYSDTSHHVCDPSALISLFHNLDILIKTLSMFIAHVSNISRKFIEMTLEEINLYMLISQFKRWMLPSIVSTKSESYWNAKTSQADVEKKAWDVFLALAKWFLGNKKDVNYNYLVKTLIVFKENYV